MVVNKCALGKSMGCTEIWECTINNKCQERESVE